MKTYVLAKAEIVEDENLQEIDMKVFNTFESAIEAIRQTLIDSVNSIEEKEGSNKEDLIKEIKKLTSGTQTSSINGQTLGLGMYINPEDQYATGFFEYFGYLNEGTALNIEMKVIASN